jgi:hypothetical protein
MTIEITLTDEQAAEIKAALPTVASSPSQTPETDRIVGRFRKGQTSSDGLILTLESIELKLNAAIATLMAIEERYIDGCDTYEDWKFMGDTARAFLSENVCRVATADENQSNHDQKP